ncbi:phthiocerol/phthiodiolone dimycocerosyl transferase family protein [Nocardia asteroides]|uniref:phthiocerol/phthiodiolone dimycocerosyl transferase family protein n=1 Tax=Nocardia asteroides TaxID=1824 RepID=UPI0034150686
MSVNRIRSLAPSELVFATPGAFSPAGLCVRVRGELDIAALSIAFAALRRRYPVLAAALEQDESGYVIVARQDPLPGVIVTEGDLEAAMPDICADQTRVLSGLYVTHDGNRAAIALFTHHSIADGHHAVTVLADLWSLYTDVVSGKPVDDTEWGYPESMEKVLADRGIHKADSDLLGGSTPQPTNKESAVEEPAAAVSEPLRVRNTPRVYSTPTARCRLDVGTTAALLAFARRNETTFNGVLSAVIMRVEAELNGVSPERIKYSYMVNLRSRIEPAVANPAVTNPLGIASFVAGGDLDDTVAVATAITGQLRDDLNDKLIHQAGLRYAESKSAMIEQLGQMPADERPIPVISTNLGVVPHLRSPAQLEFEDFRCLMPEVQVATDAQYVPRIYILSTFQDRLAIELASAADPAADQKRITAIESTLLTLI